ncbi:DUF3592 domain-containing protein [Oxalobacteraceae bacterium]|nr:DUF3592 domain-containing protein [Oxalobacteraceae bacterium]
MEAQLKLLLAAILVPFAGMLILALAYKLLFLCMSRRGTAIVTATVLREIQTSDEDVQRYHRLSIRFEVDGRSYDADGFDEQVDYAVGSEVTIRYRRGNPQDVHIGYWSSLWMLAVATALFSSFAWFAVN